MINCQALRALSKTATIVGGYFKRMVGLVAHVTRRWSYLILFFVPVIGYFVVWQYYVPEPFFIELQLECKDQECQVKLAEEDIKVIDNNLGMQIEQAERLEEFSKPFSGFIRYVPRATDESMITIAISYPEQNVPQKTDIMCELPQSTTNIFSYDSEILFGDKTSLQRVPDTLKSARDTLVGCFRGFRFESRDLDLTVGPNSIVSFNNPKIGYKIEFLLDDLSKLLLFLEVVAIWFALLSVIKVIIKLLVSGWRYFVE